MAVDSSLKVFGPSSADSHERILPTQDHQEEYTQKVVEEIRDIEVARIANSANADSVAEQNEREVMWDSPPKLDESQAINTDRKWRDVRLVNIKHNQKWNDLVSINRLAVEMNARAGAESLDVARSQEWVEQREEEALNDHAEVLAGIDFYLSRGSVEAAPEQRLLSSVEHDDMEDTRQVRRLCQGPSEARFAKDGLCSCARFTAYTKGDFSLLAEAQYATQWNIPFQKWPDMITLVAKIRERQLIFS